MVLPRPRPGPLEIATDYLDASGSGNYSVVESPWRQTPDDVAPELPERRELLPVDDDAPDARLTTTRLMDGRHPPSWARPRRLRSRPTRRWPSSSSSSVRPSTSAGPAADTGTTDPRCRRAQGRRIDPAGPRALFGQDQPQCPPLRPWRGWRPTSRSTALVPSADRRRSAHRARSAPLGRLDSRQIPPAPPILPMACYLLSVLVQLFISVCESI